MDENGIVKAKITSLLPHLNERQRRLVLAAEARALGHGGITYISSVSGVSRVTITRAIAELDEAPTPTEYARRVGGGRKKITRNDETLLADLDALVEPETRGDPECVLRWTTKSTRHLAAALNEQGHSVSHNTVADLLHDMHYSLQANKKTEEGNQHEDRDDQFRYINAAVRDAISSGQPAISVDTKKKELVGSYANGGREWQPVGEPVRVRVHDFPDPALGRAIPYGVYEIARNVGWVNVGCDHDTSVFAIESVLSWWTHMGKAAYPNAKRIVITADGGGSNGSRVYLFKRELQRFADVTGLKVTVLHLPPGTSKWNKIEHRMFSHISMNWRGRPLISHEVVVELICTTKTQTGLKVYAQLDTRKYPTKIQVTDEEMAAVNLRPHDFHGEWNYTILPNKTALQM
jgi:transposase